jgi:hypothetical protein
MRKLTDVDMENILGTIVKGYHVESVRVKRGNCTDSDHYGIIFGKNQNAHYVTWQFHLDEDETVNPYWGHYHMENREAALRDYENRDLEMQPFKVTITETLKLTVEVEAKDRHDAEQIVSDNWKKSEYILDADNFYGVEFEIVPDDEQEEPSQ